MQKIFNWTDVQILLELFVGEACEVIISDLANCIIWDEPAPTAIGATSKKKVLVNMDKSIQVDLASFDYILDFGQIDASSHETKSFNFICNPNKTIRWVYPAALKYPLYLSLYNSKGIKAKIYTNVSKWLYKLGMKGLLSEGAFRVHHLKPLRVDVVTRAIAHDQYAVFTGTVGVNRKMVLALAKENLVNCFVKWPLSKASSLLLDNEARRLGHLKDLQLPNCVVPIVYQVPETSINIYTNIKPDRIVNDWSWTPTHADALLAWYGKSEPASQYRQDFVNQCISQIESVEVDPRILESTILKSSLEKVKASLNDINVPFAIAHYDFTPWNMYFDGAKIYVYDWELSQGQAPVLFDLYHYHFQKCILVDRGDLGSLSLQIRQALQYPPLKAFIEQNNIDIAQCYRLYLAYTVSYYLNIYKSQGQLHMQVHWLADLWNKALLEVTEDVRTNNTYRKDFVASFIGFMQPKEYALMKFSEQDLHGIQDSSDLDILILKNDRDSIIKYALAFPGLVKYHIVQKSFMTTLSLYFKDGSFLSLDLLYQFKRKRDQMFSVSKVLEAAILTPQGVKVPSLIHDFEYIILFYQLNSSDVPAKYVSYFQSYPKEEQASLSKYLGAVYHIDSVDDLDLFTYSPQIKMAIQDTLNSLKMNKGLERWKSNWSYLKDILVELVQNQGRIITISGVDGAGKSTIIEDLKNSFISKYRKKVVVLRHRPSLLPILSAWKYGKQEAEAMAASKLPRQGGNKSLFSSIFRFMYYYCDYLFGQIYIYTRYILGGYTIIYDRYYFDFIEDSRRSNIQINKNIVRWLYAFIHKPSLNILLYAPAEEIRKRKQELTIEDISSLTKEYLQLFNQLSHDGKDPRYLSVENIDREETLNKILCQYVKLVA